MLRHREIDTRLAEHGWGVCPIPVRWNEFFKALQRRVIQSGASIGLEKPLILSGWSSAGYRKRRRFVEHLIAAEELGCWEWAKAYLDNLTIEDWLEPLGVEALYPEQNSVFYVTGRGGSLTGGFSAALEERLIDFTGRQINGDFLKSEHPEQVELIAQDLTQNSDKTIIANSYGAYLVLSALAQYEISLGDVFLTSPITGRSTLEGTYFKPAGANVVETAIANCEFKGSITNLAVIVGELDRQADPERCMLMAAAFQGRGNVLPNQGHQIGHGKMGWHLDEFLLSITAVMDD